MPISGDPFGEVRKAGLSAFDKVHPLVTELRMLPGLIDTRSPIS